MNNILVAIYNQKIYEELLEEKNINIINKNILYKEGILEILEKNFEINFIIINEKIPGEIEIINLIDKIKEFNNNIKIILITKENKYKKDNIFLLKEENKRDILDIIENKKELKNEREEIIQIEKIKKQIDEKLFFIKGNSGSGKSIVASILSYQISKMDKKVLLIDGDIEKGNIHTIFQVKKYINRTQKIYNNLYFINTNQEEIIRKVLTEKYDILIFDNFNKNYILEINHINIYILESNLIEIEKLKNNITDNYYNDFFIINKYNKNSIDEKIIENIFENKNILKIKYSDIYNSLINNFKMKKDNLYLKRIYKNAIKKII